MCLLLCLIILLMPSLAAAAVNIWLLVLQEITFASGSASPTILLGIRRIGQLSSCCWQQQHVFTIPIICLFITPNNSIQ